MAEPALSAPRKELTREQKEYQYRRLVSHLNEARAWSKLFDLLEEKTFLADQADHFSAFEPSGADIEQYALPAAIREKDWNRFLRFASLALNLRGVAEGLAEPDILRALIREGRFNLAQDVVDRLADPLRRAEARGVLASASRSGKDRLPDLLRAIEKDLEEASLTVSALASIARLLGPELSPRWAGWIARLLPESGDAAQVWAAVAASWLDRGETRATRLWETLARVRNRNLLLELIGRLGRLDQGNADETLAKLSALYDDAPPRWQAIALYLERQIRRRPERTLTIWDLWVKNEPIVWTVDLVETCREVLKRLHPARIEVFCSQLDDLESRAALRVADLEAHPDGRRTAAALEAVSRIPDGPAKVHWSLRYLEARPREPADEVRGQLGAVAAYLHELRYDAAASDLRRFLDLAAQSHPKELARLIEDVAWSPACRPETLLTLASDTRQETVAVQLLEHAERFAAAASLTEAEGFKLRGELIRRVACRLCLLRKDLNGLDTAIERLLPEEEDELRETLAPELSEEGRHREARVVAEGIRDPRRKFLTLLRAIPAGETPRDFFSSRSLYGAMASTRPIDDERKALSALLRNPFDPQDLARSYVLPVQSIDLRVQALIRLARHALAFQRSFYGKRQDRTAAMEVVRSSLAVETDERLAALTPEIAALGSELGVREAAAELEEAGRQLAGLGTVPWPLRAEALEHLLSLINPILQAEASERQVRRKSLSVLESFARLPVGPPADQALNELRSHWHEILPILLAAAERVPGLKMEPLRRAAQEGVAASKACGEAAETVVQLCLASPADRGHLLDQTLGSSSLEPTVLQALAYLYSNREPRQSLEVVQRLLTKERDIMFLRLVRFRWLKPNAALLIPGLIEDRVLREEACLWQSPGETHEDDWLQSLATLATLRLTDPSSPGQQPLIKRLWACNSSRSRNLLGTAFLQALRSRGRIQGEAALRLWLHAHLTPLLGTEQPKTLGEEEGMVSALMASLVLSPQSP